MFQKIVLITGCGPSGIGLALAAEFQLRGHRVIASGLNERLLEPLRELGLEVAAMDVTSETSIRQAVSNVSNLTGGRLDILVNNAGVMHIMPFTDTPLADARRVFDVNVLGVFAVTQAFLPLLIAGSQTGKAGPGQSVVANLGSVNAVFRPPFLAAYNASKAAVEVLGTTLRRELAPLGIRVVTLKTGSVRSNLFANAPETVLPQGSLYEPIKEWIEGRRMLERGQFIDSTVYARIVVDGLLKPKVKSVIWAGGLAWLAWFLSWFGWEDIMDHEMINGNRLNQVKI